MADSASPHDRAVGEASLWTPLGLCLLLACLGVAIMGARHVAGLLRGLNQNTPGTLTVERPRT